MYKLLLCWRYLRTRYIALASIISVTLGVATMIVVNAVMAGFSHEMQDRIHGILSDVVFESRHLDGASDASLHMQKIREVAGQYIEGMSPTAHVPAAMQYYVGGQHRTQQINLIGIDPDTYSSVSDFGQYLQHPENREELEFELKQGGYDVYDHQTDDPSKVVARDDMQRAGWEHRKMMAQYRQPIVAPPAYASDEAAAESDSDASPLPADPFSSSTSNHQATFDPSKEIFTGCVPGISLCSYRDAAGADKFFCVPGDDVTIMFPSAGQKPEPRSAKLTITDFYESKMQEYDQSFVFLPLAEMQKLRGLVDPLTGVANFNSIQIRLKEGVEPNMVRDLLRNRFPEQFYVVSTWRDKQGALLAAVQMETMVLNVLLFLIIAVAGFGILAIFLMIVVEKTRDIGILKSLGASGSGVMGIFLSYGLTLGAVGAGIGVVGGLVFVDQINEIADFLGWLTGTPVFDPSVYYFYKIPAIIEPFTILWVAVGAMLIAVLASVLPAWRAASLHPVQALRWE
ncbi:Lipoprotein-releasing system transmembrane protein LolC [Posidoniimonas polymericola]|uniref:Lipoprotein-releasing system transmembrane protein LolC n=1 Tax=Posidoniimonas polymericola TaxID=2528002 RepID=A0A5C5YD02_9BACT|nr:FtsX-like permease family protein [Posidoniimonas polymericola]TWT73576.1 Lipoprotein-releasing system transmembrane protein LolC [Posidoniimonas polymericola]